MQRFTFTHVNYSHVTPQLRVIKQRDDDEFQHELKKPVSYITDDITHTMTTQTLN